MQNYDRFDDCGYEVEDHPYDRGYWDRVLGHRKQRTDEEPEEQGKYECGWRAASRELRCESRNLRQQELASERIA